MIFKCTTKPEKETEADNRVHFCNFQTQCKETNFSRRKSLKIWIFSVLFFQCTMELVIPDLTICFIIVFLFKVPTIVKRITFAETYNKQNGQCYSLSGVHIQNWFVTLISTCEIAITPWLSDLIFISLGPIFFRLCSLPWHAHFLCSSDILHCTCNGHRAFQLFLATAERFSVLTMYSALAIFWFLHLKRAYIFCSLFCSFAWLP